MCQFQQLYIGNDGYVVCCYECRHYQVGYASMMLTLTSRQFTGLHKEIRRKCFEENHGMSVNAKCIIIPTSSKEVNMLLSYKEVVRFGEILEEADNEIKALTLISMFNP